MEQEKQLILNIWKRAVEKSKEKEKKLCAKYKVKLKPIEAEEYYTIFEFENGVQFTVPNDQDWEDYNLTGDALKFAMKYVDIIQDVYCETDKDLEKEGFEKVDSDECYAEWEKDELNYTVVHYADKEEDVEINKIKRFVKNEDGEK